MHIIPNTYPLYLRSSSINALVGEKKVNVGITPGKTKHFQVQFLSCYLLCARLTSTLMFSNQTSHASRIQSQQITRPADDSFE
jgi:large subunit GTPase 1